MTGTSIGTDLIVGWQLVRAEFLRRVRRVLGNRRLLAAAVLLGLFNLPVVVFLALWAHGVGQQSRTGLAFPAVAAARNLLAPMLGLYTLFSGLSAAQSLGEDRERDLLLTTVSNRALLVGEVGIEFLDVGALFVVPVAVFGTAFGLGAGTPLVVGVLLLVGLPLVVLSFLFGHLLAYAFWIGLLALPISGGIRQVFGALSAVVMVIGSLGLGFGLGGGAADGGLASAIPTGPPPTPLGWYADLLFVASPLSTPIGLRTLLAAGLVLGAIPLAVLGLTRLAPRFWYAVPNRPETDEETAAPPADTASETVGRRGRFGESQTLRLAAGYLRRVRRRPDRLTYLFYYLILAVFVGLPGVFPGSDVGVRVTALALVLFGTWLAGAAFCLNPLGDEGRMLSQLLLSETPASTVVGARFLLGVAVGLPVSLLGVAVMLGTSPIGGVAAVLTVLSVVGLVFASVGTALAIGAAVPRFGTTRLFGSVEAVAPSTTAALLHAVLSSVLAIGALNLPGLAIHATWIGPAWSRGLAFAVFGVVLLGLADGGRRYATAILATYGQDRSAVGPTLAVYTAVGLALLSFVVAQLVTAALALDLLGRLSGPRRLVVLFLAQYAGFAAVALGFRYVTRRGLTGLDRSLSSGRDGVLLAGGLIGGLAIWLVSSVLTSRFGLPAADQSLIESATADPRMLVVLVPLVVLVNAPVEELLYRGVIQDYLGETLDTTTAILLTSCLFALVHVPAYFDPNPVALAVPLASLFALSCLWGAVYELSGSLLVAAASHGLYNAVLLGVAFTSVVG